MHVWAELMTEWALILNNAQISSIPSDHYIQVHRVGQEETVYELCMYFP
jgi:hypothetical protein